MSTLARQRSTTKACLVGRRVRLLKDLNNKKGDVFRAGKVMEVVVVGKELGLELTAVYECGLCGKGRRTFLKKVRVEDVEVLSASLSSMMKNRDPNVILARVREILQEGLKGYEGESPLPRSVVVISNALSVIGTPEENGL